MTTPPRSAADHDAFPNSLRLEDFESFPLLVEAAAAFGPLNPRDYDRSGGIPPFIPEALLPTFRRYQNAAHEIFKSCVVLVLEQPDRVDPGKYLEQHLRSDDRSSATTRQLLRSIRKAVPPTVARVQEVRGLADMAIPAFEEEVAGDDKKAFVVGQMLATDPIKATGVGVQGDREQLLGLLWTLYDSQNGASDIHQLTRARLHKGQFDRFVAAQVLGEAMAQANPADDLWRFVKLHQIAAKMNAKLAIAGLADPEAVALWQGSPLEALHGVQADMGRDVEKAAELRRSYLRWNHLLLSRGTTEGLRQQVAALDKLAGRTRGRRRPTKAEAVAARVQGRDLPDRLPLTLPRKTPRKPLSRSKERTPRTRRELVYINSVGTQHEEGSQGFERLVSKYLGKHDGDALRKGDVESGFEFLRRELDFSTGNVPGVIQQQGERVTFSPTGEKLPVYALTAKPTEHHGFSRG